MFWEEDVSQAELQMIKDSGVTETWLQAASRKARRLAR